MTDETEVNAIRAENERLRKELEHTQKLFRTLQDAKTDDAKAKAKLEEAVKVLEPIVAVLEASEAHARLNGNDPDGVPDTHEVTPYKEVPNITLGHLRALKSFLANLKAAE